MIDTEMIKHTRKFTLSTVKSKNVSTCSTAIVYGMIDVRLVTPCEENCPNFNRCRQWVLAVAVVAIRFTMEMVMVVCLARLPWPDCRIDPLSLPPPSFLSPPLEPGNGVRLPSLLPPCFPLPTRTRLLCPVTCPHSLYPHLLTGCVLTTPDMQQRAIHISYVHR